MADDRVSVRPRVRRWLLVVLGVLVLVAAHAVWDYVEARLLKTVIDRIPPQTRMQEVPAVDPARDAAPYFRAAGDLVFRDFQVFDKIVGQRDLRAIALLHSALPDDVRQRARAFIAGSDALRLLDRATTLEFRGFGPGTDTAALEMNKLAELAGLRAIVLSIDGDSEAAASSIATELCIKADRHGLTYAGWLIPKFVTGVVDLQVVLTATTPDEASLARIAAALATADQDDVLARYFEYRRRFLMSNEPGFQDYAEFGRVGLFGHNQLTLVERLERPVVARRNRVVLERIQAQIDASHRPWPGRLAAIADQSATGFSVIDQGLQRDLDPAAADLAVVRAARVAVAIERYRRAHAGQVPADLSQVPASLLEALPVDPFSGAPIRFRALASGYVVYSVGPDGKDDGGATTGLEAFRGGSGARSSQHWPFSSADIGVRIAK
jgi:hypothetical protein